MSLMEKNRLEEQLGRESEILSFEPWYIIPEA
jgi:hypothetical protein